jgi:hypothetical protein
VFDVQVSIVAGQERLNAMGSATAQRVMERMMEGAMGSGKFLRLCAV